MQAQEQSESVQHGRTRRPSAFAALLLFLTILGTTLILWVVLRTQEQMRERLLQESRLMAQAIPAERILRLTASERDAEDPNYQQLKAQLKAVRAAFPYYRYIYLMGMAPATDATKNEASEQPPIFFYMDVGADQDIEEARPGEVYRDAPEAYRRVFAGGAQEVVGPYKDKWGIFVSGGAPIVDPATDRIVAVLGTDCNANDWYIRLVRAAIPPAALTLALLFICITGRILLKRRARGLSSAYVWAWHLETYLAGVTGLVITAFLVLAAYQLEQAAIRESFFQLAASKTLLVARTLETVGTSGLEGLAHFYMGSEHVSQTEFEQFADYLMKTPHVHSCGWIGAVSEASRNAFEANLRSRDQSNFRIWRDADAPHNETASDAEMYYPIIRWTPPRSENNMIGYDVGMQPQIRLALEMAEKTGAPVTSLQTSPDQDASGHLLAVYAPVYASDERPLLMGFVCVVLDLAKIVSPDKQSRIGHIDIAALHRNGAAVSLAQSEMEFESMPALAPVKRPLLAFGNAFIVLARAGDAYWHRSPFQPAFIGLFIGLLLTFLCVGALHIVLRQRERLRSREMMLRSFMDHSLMAIAIVDGAGRIIEWNPEAEVITGLKREETVSMSFDQVAMRLAPPANSAKEKAPPIYGKTALDAASELRLLRADGAVRVLRQLTFPIRMPQGNMRGILAEDISARKQSEEEIQQLRHYLASVIDSMPSILIGVDGNCRITQWNQKVIQCTGLSTKEALGRSIENVFPMLAPHMPEIRVAVRSHQSWNKHRATHVDASGALRYDDIVLFPLLDAAAGGAVIRVDDVTERVHMEEMMVQNEKMLSVGGLAAGMAHEINNPLGGMIQTATVLEERLLKPLAANQLAAEKHGISLDAMRAYMETRNIPRLIATIRESGSRAAAIVRNMLSFARKSDASFLPCNLAELVEQTIELAMTDYDLKKKHDFKSIEIVRQYAEDMPLVPCDARKIQQVILNLLKNAADAIHGGATTPHRNDNARIVIRLAWAPGWATLEIEDNGPGMDPTLVNRIFEPFYTTKPVDQGTGLGLSISYFIIVENHGGRINVLSAPGQGARFIIQLPLKEKKGS